VFVPKPPTSSRYPCSRARVIRYRVGIKEAADDPIFRRASHVVRAEMASLPACPAEGVVPTAMDEAVPNSLAKDVDE